MTLAEKLSAARRGAAVGPVVARGVLRLAGKDARDYLHRMSTQHLARLAPGESAYAAFLTARGHLVGDGLVVARPGDLLVLTEPAAAAPLASHLRKFVIMDDVVVEDVSASWRVLPVLGPRGIEQARAAAASGARGAAASGAPGAGSAVAAPGVAALAATPRRGAPALEVVAGDEAASWLRDRLLAAGAAELSEADLEALRLEAGLAQFGVDMDGDRLPMEAGLTRDAIHFDKGCYVGQEVVLRATVRGHLQKGLVQLELPAGAGPGARLRAGGLEVGWVTSAGETSGGRLGLGYVKRAWWKEGAALETDAGPATVRSVVVHEPEA